MEYTKAEVRKEKRIHLKEEAMQIQLRGSQKRAIELAKEKGASVWLTTLPLEKYGIQRCSGTKI